MPDPQERWKDSLAIAAARAYEAAHGSAISETRRGLRFRMTWRQAVAALVLIGVALGVGLWLSRLDAVAATPLGSPIATADATGSVVVDVGGAVEAPGLVELAMGARVADAIEAAGGARADAVLDDLNLARRVDDGEQITVPRTGDREAEAEGGLIDLNSASASQLEDLPGVGPTLAQRIVADREANGPFASLADLGRVAGVGDAIVGSLDGIATV